MFRLLPVSRSQRAARTWTCTPPPRSRCSTADTIAHSCSDVASGATSTVHRFVATSPAAFRGFRAGQQCWRAQVAAWCGCGLNRVCPQNSSAMAAHVPGDCAGRRAPATAKTIAGVGVGFPHSRHVSAVLAVDSGGRMQSRSQMITVRHVFLFRVRFLLFRDVAAHIPRGRARPHARANRALLGGPAAGGLRRLRSGGHVLDLPGTAQGPPLGVQPGRYRGVRARRGRNWPGLPLPATPSRLCCGSLRGLALLHRCSGLRPWCIL